MAEPLRERDVIRFRMLADPQVSPDGGRVAFVVFEQDAEANHQATSIWTVAADGSAPARRLTAGPRDLRPRWSPDGSRLAFLGAREREWAKDLYVLDMGGGEPQCVARLPRGITDYAWSEDHCLCLVGGPEYPSDPDRDPPTSPEETRRRYVERVRHVRRFRYRLDGHGALDDEARQLWVVGADGSGLRMVTQGPTDVSRPRWMADGRVAFLGNREPDHDTSDVVEVYAVDVASGRTERLTHADRFTAGFAFGPEARLAVLRAPTPFGGRHLRLWIDDECVSQELDRTSAPLVLADTAPMPEPADPVWAGDWVYFEVADRGRMHVYRARAGGRPELVLGCQRVIHSFSVGGGRIAFISTSPEDPLSLRIADMHGSEERLLFEANPWVRERALGRLERFDFEHDGRHVDAWALLPPGHDARTRLPTVLYIHGGPHAAYGWSFPLVFQILAGAGHAVVYCNPPGSQSYSEEFASSLHGAWGEMDLPYFMALVDRAVEAGFADPERLGVAGGSYGGYSTLWAITHTNRFRAAVSMRPVATLQGFYGSSDIGWEFGSIELGAEPWEDPALYRRLSPLTYLSRVTTPLRLIASTGDLRTPAEQAENVFVRLRKMGKEVDLVVFHDEPHSVVVAGRPWNRVRHIRAVLEWFQRHLVAPTVASPA